MDKLIKEMNTFDLGFNVTVTGVALVFSMLVLLVVILYIFGKVFVAIGKNAERKAQKDREATIASMSAAPVIKADPTPTPVVATQPSSGALSDELVAVISAAVASMYSGSGKKPVIRSIKRSVGTRSAWAKAGIADNTRAF